MSSTSFVAQLYEHPRCSRVPSTHELGALWQHAQKKKGWIYAAENNNIPGRLKLGYTQKHPFERARTLKTAGVIGTFSIVKAYQVVDCITAEAKVHSILEDVRADGEFFWVTPDAADVVLKQVWLQEREKLKLFQVDWLLHDTDSNRFAANGFNISLWSDMLPENEQLCYTANSTQEMP